MVEGLKSRWQAGISTVNGWLNIPSGFSAEVMAQAGWDSITVDLQHGVQDYMSMVACFQALQAHPIIPMARIPWYEPGIIGKVLDAGAYGVICPMIDTAEDAKDFVVACRYPPLGKRSNGPIRAGLYTGGVSYQATANEAVLCIPMIETREALQNLDSILDVPGVDAVYVGPSDLGFSLGLPPVVDREEQQMIDTYGVIIDAAKQRGVGTCIHCISPTYALRMIAMGFNHVTIGWDSLYIMAGAKGAVNAVRDGLTQSIARTPSESVGTPKGY